MRNDKPEERDINVDLWTHAGDTIISARWVTVGKECAGPICPEDIILEEEIDLGQNPLTYKCASFTINPLLGFTERALKALQSQMEKDGQYPHEIAALAADILLAKSRKDWRKVNRLKGEALQLGWVIDDSSGKIEWSKL